MRERWDNRLAFILAAIGSAIGLGNVWRFPYICFKYGGGAFLIPYFVALLTAGIPIMILEFALGYKMQGSAPDSFGKTGKNKEWLGWFAILVAFGIVSYYAVIMGWCCNYFYYSFKLGWGKNPGEFFFKKFLNLSGGPYEYGKFEKHIILGLIIAWVSIIACIWKGPKTVGKVVYATVILPWVILIIFVIRGVTLPGAIEGLKYYLTPNFEALKSTEVWLNAYSQVFFSLSIGFGVMVAYASYLPRGSDIVANAFIVSLADAFTAFVAGFAVFSCLGYYANVQHLAIKDVVTTPIPLAFITYPTIINLLPFARPVFGVLFFFMLITLAIDSAFSLVEAFSCAIQDKWSIKKRWIINISIGVGGILLGLFYVHQAGLYWIDIVDHFMSNFGLMIVALLECILLGYFYKLSDFQDEINPVSSIKAGKWWIIAVKVIAPAILIWLIIHEIIERITKSYEGYPRSAEFLGGWLLLIIFTGLAIFLAMRRKR